MVRIYIYRVYSGFGMHYFSVYTIKGGGESFFTLNNKNSTLLVQLNHDSRMCQAMSKHMMINCFIQISIFGD